MPDDKPRWREIGTLLQQCIEWSLQVDPNASCQSQGQSVTPCSLHHTRALVPELVEELRATVAKYRSAPITPRRHA